MKNYFKPLLEEKLTSSLLEKFANEDGIQMSVQDGFFAGGEEEEDVW